MPRKSVTLKGSVLKRWRGRSGGWRRNDGKVGYMNQGDLLRYRTVFMRPSVDRRWTAIHDEGAEEPPEQESEQP